MVLRELFKCNGHNSGTRTLLESILVPEVLKAITDWKKASNTGVLIGGLALSYYVKPRQTTDGDFLFLTAGDIPAEVAGFKRTRLGAFMHKKTHVEIEVLLPESINMPSELAHQITDTAVEHGDFLVASREGLIAAKLLRFKLQDQADIVALLQLGEIDMSNFTLSEKQQKNLAQAIEAAEREKE